MKRIIPLVNDEIYHVVNRSIAEFKIFNNDGDFLRMMYVLRYYQKDPTLSFSHFMTHDGINDYGFERYFYETSKRQDKQVQIIAFCLMPTHIHITLKQLKDNGITRYLGNVLNGYSKYFNTKYHRKGPLWEAKFKNILVESDEQLLHLTRYIHLNPATALLVGKPENWKYSSYHEYLKPSAKFRLTDFNDIIDIKPSDYRKFVDERISYQRALAKIKTLLLD